MPRSFFQRIPFIRISGLFVLGIVVGYSYVPGVKILAMLLTFLFVIHIVLWFNSSFAVTRIQNILLSVSIFLTGVFYASNCNDKPDFQRNDYFLAQVCQKPAEKARTYQTIVSVQNKELVSPEKVVAYFDKSGFDSTITTGDQLIILGKLQKIKNQGNPYEFDYQAMMHRRNIWYSVYLTRATYLKTGNRLLNWENWAEKLRDILVEKLAGVLPDKEERSVVSALTLGYRTELDQETLDYFASTGAMHVLSVSGLHVGLLFMILGFFLGFLKRGKIGRVLFPGVMILLLWMYAFVSGFSPPVQRATVMFTFVIVGNAIRRPVNIYNSLTASALLLILLDPGVVFDVGFQLSYLAIFGIVLIQPALYNITAVRNKSLQWLWALFTVSVAAQLVTFPLGVFYFNQFPNFFWLSNFIVVPVTTFIMWASLVFFIVVPLQGMARLVGIVIQKLTWLMLLALKTLDAHPLAVTRGLVFSAIQVFLVFGLMFAFVIFFLGKRKVWLVTGLVLLVGFQIETLIGNLKLLNQRFLLVYHSKSTMIHLANGRTNYLIAKEEEMRETDKKTIQKVVDHRKLKPPVFIPLDKANGFKRSDLSISKHAIHFLNCRIGVEKKAKNTKQDEFIIEVGHPVKTTRISTGYPSVSNKSKADFYTPTDGAYWLALN
jgi:competence protein ComEC